MSVAAETVDRLSQCTSRGVRLGSLFSFLFIIPEPDLSHFLDVQHLKYAADPLENYTIVSPNLCPTRLTKLYFTARGDKA